MTRQIQMFNKYASDNQNIIQKALTSATGIGEALIPENLERIITDTVIRLSPELALLTSKKIAGKVHEFDRLTRRPKRGGAMGENATTPVSNSRVERDTVTLKVIRRKGKVTNFLRDTSEEFIDAASYEMQNHLQAHVLDLIWYILWGNLNSNAYEFNGIEVLASSNRTNEIRGGVVPTSLKTLDNMIDASNRKGGRRHNRVFNMTPEMLSTFSRLETTIRKTVDIADKGNAFSVQDFPGGWRLLTYRDIPIIESTSMGPIEQLTSTVTLADEATLGALSDGTYYVQVAPVTLEGEQEASAEGTVVVNGGGAAQRIKITIDAVHTTNTIASPLAYKIYASQTSGAEILVKIVPAFTYDSDGTILLDNMLAADPVYITSLTSGTDVPTHMEADVPLVANGGIYPENLMLWDLDPIQGLGKLPYTNRGGSEFNGLVTTEPLAQTDDFIQFLVKSYLALADSYETTTVWHRGLRKE